MDPKAQQLQESWPTEHDAYELLGKIGYGAFATVWRAHSKIKTTKKKNDDCIDSESTAMTKTGPLCAIKIINLEHIDTNFVGKENVMSCKEHNLIIFTSSFHTYFYHFHHTQISVLKFKQ